MISSVPIYDYRCDHCGHAFSAVQSFNDSALETCPNCGKKPRRLIVAPAIVFKGGGWYKTDSRGAAPKDGEAPKTETVKTDAPKSDATTKDTKKETKSETKSDSATSSSSGSAKSEGTS